jgi:hypothetical protein
MADQKLSRNRKERRQWTRRLQSEDPGLEVVHPHAAGIDVGNGAHYVAVRPDRDPEPVRRFECFTADLYRLADWLHQCGVKTVAMHLTGVYWIPIYGILEERSYRAYAGRNNPACEKDAGAGVRQGRVPFTLARRSCAGTSQGFALLQPVCRE